MSATLDQNVTTTLRRAAVKATLAPSVHNTQPWRFVISNGQLDVFADPTRQLRVLDPAARQLVISCGCALFNARVTVAGAGYDDDVQRLPDPAQPHLLARVHVGSRRDEPGPLARLESVIEARQTNRRQFASDAVADEVVDELMAVAAAEGARLIPIVTDEHRYAVAQLSQEADKEEYANPAYRAELRAWTTDDPQRRDGVPAMAVPRVDGLALDDIPLRDFDTHGSGWLPSETRSSLNQCLLLLGTDTDEPLGWLHAGEALERVLLEITRHGLVASPLTQMIENAAIRLQLRTALGLTMFPHVLLRVGRAPFTPATRRRRLVEVLVDGE
jgi:hypothetical protein